nr:histidine kinase [uncultured Allomuricauda sp.]
MKKLFIHKPFFRLLSPLFSGTLVYLLILLINNSVADLNENFFGQELYVCIGLAYLIQEYVRFSIVIFKRITRPSSFVYRIALQIVSTLMINIVLVSLAMHVYFTNVLFYSLNSRELLIFNSIFSVIALIYILLYVSHQFLFKINTEKMEKEEWARQEIEEDFVEFKRDINPMLLFESLEAILAIMKEDPDKAELVTDRFALVYRYFLSRKKDELVPVKEEVEVLEELTQLLSELPYRKVSLGKVELGNTVTVPGSMLQLLELIMRSTIPSKNKSLVVDIKESENEIIFKYIHEEKISKELNIKNLKFLSKEFSYYASQPIQILHEEDFKTIHLPKLTLA